MGGANEFNFEHVEFEMTAEFLSGNLNSTYKGVELSKDYYSVSVFNFTLKVLRACCLVVGHI